MEMTFQAQAAVAVVLVVLYGRITAATWCVVRSEASREALQVALDYACAAGADCAPIQQNGLCFLPNTIQAHASYAFNSYYMRRSMAAGSCEFGGTATIAKTDPSYGSCVYPASPSTAGGNIPTPGGGISTNVNTPIAPPSTTTPPFGFNPIGMVPTLGSTSNAKSSTKFSMSRIWFLSMIFIVIDLLMFL